MEEQLTSQTENPEAVENLENLDTLEINEQDPAEEPTPIEAPDSGDPDVGMHPGASAHTQPQDAEEIARLVAEAEERGYLRGRNESIAALMEQSRTLNGADNRQPHEAAREAPEVMILNNLRRSVWD